MVGTSVAGSCGKVNDTFGYYGRQEIVLLAERLLVFEQALCSVEVGG